MKVAPNTTMANLIQMDLDQDMDSITDYAITKMKDLLVGGDEELLQELINESCDKRTIISKGSLQHLKGLSKKRLMERSENISLKNNQIYKFKSGIESLKLEYHNLLEGHQEEGSSSIEESASLKKNFYRKRDAFIGVIEQKKELMEHLQSTSLAEGETLLSLLRSMNKISSFKEDNLKSLISSGLDSNVEDLIKSARLYQLSAGIEKQQSHLKLVEEQKKAAEEPDKLNNLLTEESYTFDEFLQESVKNLRDSLKKDTSEYKGFIHELINYKPTDSTTSGVSYAFGFVSSTQIATVSPHFGKNYHDIVIPMSDRLTQAAGTYSGLRSSHFDTLGHESVHLVSMRCSLNIQEPMEKGSEYGDRVSEAIGIIKDQNGLYPSKKSERSTMMLEDEVIANFIGDIVLNDPDGSERRAFEIRLRDTLESENKVFSVVRGLFNRYSEAIEGKEGLSQLSAACVEVVEMCDNMQAPKEVEQEQNTFSLSAAVELTPEKQARNLGINIRNNISKDNELLSSSSTLPISSQQEQINSSSSTSKRSLESEPWIERVKAPKKEKNDNNKGASLE